MLLGDDLVKSIMNEHNEKQTINKARLISAEAQIKLAEEKDKQKQLLKDVKIPIYNPTDILNDWKTNNNAAKDPLPLIDKEFGRQLPLKKGDMVVFAAKAKNGKTSIATSICKSLFEAKKKVLYITNEEKASDILGRIAGIVSDNFFHEVHQGLSDDEAMNEMASHIDDIQQYIQIITNETVPLYTYQGLKTVLDKHGKNYDVIVIDYLSNVSEDLDNLGGSDWQAQERLYNYLNSFKIQVPIIAFTQIKQGSKDEDDVGHKIEGRKKLKNIVTAMIEVIPDKKSGTTRLTLSGLRWVNLDNWYLKYHKGLLTSITEQEWFSLVQLSLIGNISPEV